MEPFRRLRAGVDTRRVAAEQPLAYIGARTGDSTRVAPARLVVTHSNAEVEALRRDVNRWFGWRSRASAGIALALAAWLALGLSRPLAALARATSTIQLEGPELELATGRDDEIGALARRFGAMGRRLRASAVELRDAERRATVGEMARQVNHDIKNGLIPIRNVRAASRRSAGTASPNSCPRCSPNGARPSTQASRTSIRWPGTTRA